MPLKPNLHGRSADSWWADSVPTTGPTGTAALWRGGFFTVNDAGFIAGARVYVPAADDGIRFFYLSTNNTPPGPEKVGSFVNQHAANGAAMWLQAWVHPRMPVKAGDLVMVFCTFPVGRRFQTTNALAGGAVTHGPLTLTAGLQLINTVNFNTSPTSDLNAYGVDVLFEWPAGT